ncbi:phospholipase D family protein [Thalassolituus pacificus]|uniref:Phospholipase D family protein n=1 Tax=Thalassolituus pacificus TaxID=2975440 RepID=A0A9X2WE11_9GAMM|nr:phospholipase D family protein [Thalassolituus pacificus]MCT7358598.1 phospholipase D family protein [Thalassolituus pacificus]
MAKFLNTTSLNFYLEELIKKSTKNLILISPYLKINTRLKELLAFKADSECKIRIVYGKKEMAPAEQEWLATQKHIRVQFCKNLHAKCYMNDRYAIISSLNLYEFSQVNNNEMGLLIDRAADTDAFIDTFEEVSRIFRISEAVSFGDNIEEPEDNASQDEQEEDSSDHEQKLTTSKLAKKYKMKTPEALIRLCELGYLELRDDRHYLTDKGKDVGGEFRLGRHGIYFLWPSEFKVSN